MTGAVWSCVHASANRPPVARWDRYGGGVPTLRQVLARAIGGVAIIGLVAGAAACNKSSSSDTAGGNSKCGYELAFFGALTGSSANLGVNIEQGFELAVDQYND